MHRLRPIILGAAILTLLGPTAGSAAPVPRLEVRGRITDQDGKGVAGLPVRFLQGRRDFRLFDWEFDDELLHEVVTRTDAHGFFEATLTPNPDYRHFWLRFYEAETFDAVRYRLPADANITDRVRSGRPVIRTIVLEDHPDWPRVQAWIERLGSGSPRGEIVRRLGIPDRREQRDGVESFWYHDAAKVYRFRDGEFIGEEKWIASAAPDVQGS